MKKGWHNCQPFLQAINPFQILAMTIIAIPAALVIMPVSVVPVIGMAGAIYVPLLVPGIHCGRSVGWIPATSFSSPHLRAFLMSFAMAHAICRLRKGACAKGDKKKTHC
jgi:hypothetical protein